MENNILNLMKKIDDSLPASALDVVNLALELINIKPINALDANLGGLESACCNYYHKIRREVLKDKQPSFSIKKVMKRVKDNPPYDYIATIGKEEDENDPDKLYHFFYIADIEEVKEMTENFLAAFVLKLGACLLLNFYKDKEGSKELLDFYEKWMVF